VRVPTSWRDGLRTLTPRPLPGGEGAKMLHYMSLTLYVLNSLVNLVPIGGDFGGKGSLMDIALCYHLVRRTSRPVKMVMT